MLYRLGDLTPRVHPSAWVAPTAVLIGDVTLEEDVSVWFGAVLRGDAGPIVIGAGSNVQDNAVLHETTTIGKRCTVAHLVLAHRCRVGDGVLIGNCAAIFGDCEIGDGAVIGAGSVVTPGTRVPAGALVLGIPGKVVREASESDRAMALRVPNSYMRFRQRYMADFEPLG
ncbi:MAG: gamma carbonic anhydrase family protein [Chloroflexi bacterium]|nr:gamma carbonic anhydrase family protein [Chloroflexota bacterium]